jgi:hypothetical protein
MPLDPVMSHALNELNKQLTTMQGRITQLERNQRSTQLENTTVENGAVTFNDPNGNPAIILGAQSDGSFAHSAVGLVNPETPSDPVVVPSVGGLAVTWDGFMADGTPPLADFSRIEVHCSTVNAFTPTQATYQGHMVTAGTFNISGLTPGTVYYILLVTVNASGNPSPATDYIIGIPLLVPGTSIVAASITANQIAANTITGNQIAANTITAVQIQAGTITATQLSAGIIYAGIVNGTTITGATINADGPQGGYFEYDAILPTSQATPFICATLNAAASGTSYVASVSTAVPKGNGIVVCATTTSSANAVNSVADSKGNVYRLVASNATNTQTIYVFYCYQSDAALTTSDTITVTTASGTPINIYAVSGANFGNIDINFPFGATNGGGNVAVSGTPAYQNEAALIFMHNATTSPTWASGNFTQFGTTLAGNGAGFLSAGYDLTGTSLSSIAEQINPGANQYSFVLISFALGPANLISSVTPIAGVDPYANATLQGTTDYYRINGISYIAFNISHVTAQSALAWYTATSPAGPWTYLNSQIYGSANGGITISAGSGAFLVQGLTGFINSTGFLLIQTGSGGGILVELPGSTQMVLSTAGVSAVTAAMLEVQGAFGLVSAGGNGLITPSSVDGHLVFNREIELANHAAPAAPGAGSKPFSNSGHLGTVSQDLNTYDTEQLTVTAFTSPNANTTDVTIASHAVGIGTYAIRVWCMYHGGTAAGTPAVGLTVPANSFAQATITWQPNGNAAPTAGGMSFSADSSGPTFQTAVQYLVIDAVITTTAAGTVVFKGHTSNAADTFVVNAVKLEIVPVVAT